MFSGSKIQLCFCIGICCVSGDDCFVNTVWIFERKLIWMYTLFRSNTKDATVQQFCRGKDKTFRHRVFNKHEVWLQDSRAVSSNDGFLIFHYF